MKQRADAQMGVFYLFSKRVLRSIPYGEKPRQRLDIYVPRHHWRNPDVCIPVVIYVTGFIDPPSSLAVSPLSYLTQFQPDGMQALKSFSHDRVGFSLLTHQVVKGKR